MASGIQLGANMNKQSVNVALAASIIALATLVRPAAAQVAGFSDVPGNHWAASSISGLAGLGIVNGYSSAPLAVGSADKSAKPKAKATYDGKKPVTRYELAITLYRFVQYMDRVDKQPKSRDGAMAQPKSGADAIQKLVAGGYLPKKSVFVAKATKGGMNAVTSDEFADALGDVLTKIRENKTPISKDLKLDIEKPDTDDHSHTH